jgi:hypothetical protein
VIYVTEQICVVENLQSQFNCVFISQAVCTLKFAYKAFFIAPHVLLTDYSNLAKRAYFDPFFVCRMVLNYFLQAIAIRHEGEMIWFRMSEQGQCLVLEQR